MSRPRSVSFAVQSAYRLPSGATPHHHRNLASHAHSKSYQYLTGTTKRSLPRHVICNRYLSHPVRKGVWGVTDGLSTPRRRVVHVLFATE